MNNGTDSDSKTLYESDSTIYEAGLSARSDSETVFEGVGFEPSKSSLSAFAVIPGLPDVYEVRSAPIYGGMGFVCKVRHTQWQTDLALKLPKRECFSNEAQKKQFEEECRVWIRLGLHPNIVPCYYTRDINGSPAIFSEWMDNGSLENRIRDGSVYAGDPASVQKRLLDLSLQFVRGLKYAHEQGIIHQDVKPDNLLLSKDGRAAVADFGLARARTGLTSTVRETAKAASDPGAAVVVSGSGYTPAYCSPEQMNREPLSARTDIYSWAVSVLELYCGERIWQSGVIAGLCCTEYMDRAAVPIPAPLRTLLTQCLNEQPADRPANFGIVEKDLLNIYREITGEKYPRPSSKAAVDSALSLSNRAISLWDLGEKDEAYLLLEQAVQNGGNAAVQFNRALACWRNGDIDDDTLLDTVTGLPADGSLPNLKEKIAEIHLERDDPDAAAALFPDGLPEYLKPAYDFIRKQQRPPFETVLPPDDRKSETVLENGIPVRRPLPKNQPSLPKVVDSMGFSGMTKKLSPNGKFFAYDNPRDGFTSVAEYPSLRVMYTMPYRSRELSFSPDSSRLYVCPAIDAKIEVYDTSSGKLLHTFGRQKAAGYLIVSPDGKKVLAGDYEKAEVRDAESGQSVTLFRGKFPGRPMFSDDSKLAALCFDTPTSVWDARKPEPAVVRACPAVLYRAGGVPCHVAGSVLQFADAEKFEQSVERAMALLDEKKYGDAMRLALETRNISGHEDDPMLRLVIRESGRGMYRLAPVRLKKLCSFSSPLACLFSRNGSEIILIGNDYIRRLNADTGRVLGEVKAVMPPFGGHTCRCCLSPDGKSLFVSGSTSGKEEQLKMYRIQILTGKQEAEFDLVKDIGLTRLRDGYKIIRNFPSQLFVTGGGSTLFAEFDGFIASWNAKTGQLLRISPYESFAVNGVSKAVFRNVNFDPAFRAITPDTVPPNKSSFLPKGPGGIGLPFNNTYDAFFVGESCSSYGLEMSAVRLTGSGLQRVCWKDRPKKVLFLNNRCLLGLDPNGCKYYTLDCDKGTPIAGDTPASLTAASPDGCRILSESNDSCTVYELEWTYEERPADDWLEAEAYFRNFRLTHAAYNKEDRLMLLETLQNAGYGHITEDALVRILPSVPVPNPVLLQNNQRSRR